MQLNRTALLLVDLQNDFLPGGALPVPRGDEILLVANKLLPLPFALRVASLDWHPTGHISFASSHPGKHPGEQITLSDGSKQMLWPVHCLQGSWGSELSAKLDRQQIDAYIHKGELDSTDSYSTFFDNAHQRATPLADLLKKKTISTIYILGLATDYCVLYSVIDGLSLGFEVYVIVDGCRGIDSTGDGCQAAFSTMQKKGAHLITSEEVLASLQQWDSTNKP